MEIKGKVYIFTGAILLIVITIILYVSTFAQPKVKFKAQISKISEADYKRIMSNGQVLSQDNGIDKFRHIDLEVKVTVPAALIKHASIEPSQRYIITPYLKDNNKMLLLSGGGSWNGDGRYFNENVEIYMKDISEDELRKILGDLKVKVTWQNIFNKSDDKIYYFKDYLK